MYKTPRFGRIYDTTGAFIPPLAPMNACRIFDICYYQLSTCVLIPACILLADVLLQAVSVALLDDHELQIVRARLCIPHHIHLNVREPRGALQGRGALVQARRRPDYARRAGSTSCCSWPRTRPRAWRPRASSGGFQLAYPRGYRLLA